MALPSSLVDYLCGIAPLPRSLIEALESLMTRRELGAREHFSPLGTVQSTVGLLESGIMRAYRSTAQREYTGHLYFAPALVGDYASLITGEPVHTPQETLVTSVVWEFPFAAVIALEKDFPELKTFRRIFAEAMYLLKERREVEIVTLSATQRYVRLRKRMPGIDDLLPQYEIASHLGITASQLSRIRSRLGQG